MARKAALAYVVAWLVPTLALAVFWRAQYGYFALTRPGAGILLWEGIGDYPNPWGVQADDMQADAFATSRGARENTPAYDNVLLNDALGKLRSDPGWTIQTALRRLRSIVLVEGADWGVHNFYLEVLAPPLVVLVALAGLWRERRRLVAQAFMALGLSRLPLVLLHYEARYAFVLVSVWIVGLALLTSRRIRSTGVRE